MPLNSNLTNNFEGNGLFTKKNWKMRLQDVDGGIADGYKEDLVMHLSV